ncbi:hypothetical protein P3T35_007215 [Kitasatospora sp. GP30]|uniref:hypothetical protein n=1 Tax=Kitasatospora sp. GP30 TaxID=3035084 RepID=UPI002473540D|nr:hypothetical protein [Kitasatospora sp. GP30]MDH6145164.1 hypothetical protein [Kitasatospora sp. GP30]
MSMMTGDEKHGASATSTLDVLWVLYDKVLRMSLEQPDASDRDRFLRSKGHGPLAYYYFLAAKGFVAVDELATFGRAGSTLGHHRDRTLVAGVGISSGSLGHRLPLATGTALGLRAQGRTEPRVFCLIGDGELEDTQGDWEVHVPGHRDEVEPLLRAAVSGGRAYIRLSERANGTAHAPEPGRVRVLRRGRLGTGRRAAPATQSGGRPCGGACLHDGGGPRPDPRARRAESAAALRRLLRQLSGGEG